MYQLAVFADCIQRAALICFIWTIHSVVPAACNATAPSERLLAPATPQPANPEGSIPTFAFKTPYIEQWLLLGPIESDIVPQTPEKLLTAPAAGKVVDFGEGIQRTWQTFSAGEKGIVALTEFCRSEGQVAKNATVYACVKLSPGEREPRAFRVQADDTARLWLLHEGESDELSSNGSFIIDFAGPLAKRDSDDIYLLVEVTNFDGQFDFRVECGQRWVGRVTHADGFTPNINIPVDVLDKDGKRLFSSLSNNSGQLSLQPIPYDAPVQLSVGGAIQTPSWSVDQETENRSFHITAPNPAVGITSTLLSANDSGARRIIALQYDEKTGHIYFLQDGQRNAVQVSVGGKVHTHPLMDDLPTLTITDFAVDSLGALYLQAGDHGLLRLTKSRRTQLFARRRLEGFEQTTLPTSCLFTNECILRVHNDSVWITAVEFTGNDQDPTAMSVQSSVINVSGDGEQFQIVETRGGMINTLMVDDRGIAFSAGTQLLRRDFEAAEFESFTMPFTFARDIKRGPFGDIYLLADLGFAQLDESGAWKDSGVFPKVLPSTQSRIYPGEKLWIMDPHGARFIDNGVPAIVWNSEFASSAAWGTKGLLVGTESGSIVGVETSPVLHLDAKNGLGSSRNWKVAASRYGTVFSGLNVHLSRLSDGDWTTPVRYKTLTGYAYSPTETLAVAYALGANSSTNYNVPALLLRDDGQETHQIKLPTEQSAVVFSSIVHSSDGRFLIGTRAGLFEYADGDVKRVHLGAESTPPPISGMSELPSGAIWIATEDARFGRLDRDGVKWLELPQPENGTRHVQHFAAVPNDWPLYKDAQLLLGTTMGLLAYNIKEASFCPIDVPFSEGVNIQDLAACPMRGTVFVAARGLGVFSFHRGSWRKLRLPDDTDLSEVCDIEFDLAGKMWMVCPDKFVSYQHAASKPFVYIESTKSDQQWKPAELTSPQTTTLERDRPLQIMLGNANPLRHAGYRYRIAGQSDWTPLPPESKLLEISIPETGRTELQVQSVDFDHNFSEPLTLPIQVYLPLWRWQLLRWLAAGLLLGTSVASVLSLAALRRSRAARIQSEIQARRTAEANAREREGLLLRVCHDLKNPLHVVFACAEMLDNGELTQEEASPLLNGSAESMSYLSQQLLSYSRLGHTQANFKRTPILLRTLFAELKREFKFTKGGETTTEIAISIQPDAPRWLLGDPFVLKEIINNLLDNAFKHCPAGEVRLLATIQNGQPAIIVEDSGPGIPEGDIERIFEAFYQAGDSPMPVDQGIGLGLAICKHLAHKIGGTLAASNLETVGAQFTLLLPASAISRAPSDSLPEEEITRVDSPEAVPVLPPHTPTTHTPTKHTARRTLVVDDLAFVGKTLVQLLTKCGANATFAGPFDALSTSFQEPFDEVLVDLNMQGKDGFEVARELRKAHGDQIHIRAMSESEHLLSLAQESDVFDSAISKTALFRSTELASKSQRSRS
ncbi:MAG: hypothetical protein Aurels2KO_29640 [Aureliella sp.]